MKKLVTLNCEECGASFEREEKEVKRSRKKGRKFFCSLKCSCTFIDRERMSKGEKFSLPKEFIGKGSQKNDLSIYRPLFKRVNNRKNKKDITLTLTDIKDIWEGQKGVCVYTGIKLELPEWGGSKNIRTASIDRIDPSVGYTKENCQIVSIMANFAKNDFTHQDMVDFCNEIKKNGQVS